MMKKIFLIFLLLTSCSEDMGLMDKKRILATNISSPFPVADDGYLYIMSLGQSNMVGSYPNTSSLLYSGDMTNPTNVEVQDGAGGWKNATYQDSPFSSYGNNIALTFCRELALKYGLKIRLIHNASGAKSIEDWIDGGIMWTATENIYAPYKTGGEWNDNIRPASLWLFHQGENNQTEDYATYYPKWNTVKQQLIDAEYLSPNFDFICGELARVRQFNSNVLRPIAALSNKYRIAHANGCEKGDLVHFLGRGLQEMGERYLVRYEEIMFGIQPPNDLVVPGGITPTVSNLTSTGCTLTWSAPTVNSGLSIVKYKIYNQNGYIYYDEVDGSTLTIDVVFSKSTGEIEGWNVLAEDSAGNSTMWLAEGNQLDITIP